MAKRIQGHDKYIGTQAELDALVTTGFKPGVQFILVNGSGLILDVLVFDGTDWNGFEEGGV